MKSLIVIALSVVMSLTACDKSGGPVAKKDEAAQAVTKEGPATPVKSADGHVHTPGDVKPGSHEDWCDEHAVPESQCSRCNAELIAAFKATGDWCEEHGVPESQCLKCNPEIKIVRPPKAE